MKKNYFFSKITTFLLCFILLKSTTVAFAASTTLMTYNGTEIRAKASVQNFKLTNQTTITIDHNQTIDAAYKARESSCSMTVKLQKKGTIKYNDTGDSVKTYGSGGFRKSYTKSSGTYRLYFSSTALSDGIIPSFSINGTVKK